MDSSIGRIPVSDMFRPNCLEAIFVETPHTGSKIGVLTNPLDSFWWHLALNFTKSIQMDHTIYFLGEFCILLAN